MSHRFAVPVGKLTVALAVAFVLSPQVAGQGRTASTKTVPRTSDGRPDLQGVWTNSTITPFERPAAFKDKEYFTEEEAAAVEALTAQAREDSEEAGQGNVVGAIIPGDPSRPPAPRNVGTGTYNQFWTDQGTKILPSRRTSLIIDPPSGTVPLRREAEEKKNYYTAHSTDSYEFMSVWDRCITRGIPGSMFPTVYNNFYQFIQTPGYVAILYEMIHEPRIIPLDGRPHVAPGVRLWNGDPRGRWEGDTLVVDTTNFNDKGMIALAGAAGRMNRVPASDALHVVERFKRVDADTISYQATIDDPKMYTAPWTVDIPLRRDSTARIFEYACHEGNQMPVVALGGAREQEKAAEDAVKEKAK